MDETQESAVYRAAALNAVIQNADEHMRRKREELETMLNEELKTMLNENLRRKRVELETMLKSFSGEQAMLYSLMIEEQEKKQWKRLEESEPKV